MKPVTITEALKVIGCRSAIEIFDAISAGKVMVARGRSERSSTKLDPRSFLIFCKENFGSGVDMPTRGGMPSRRRRRKIHGEWR